MLLELKRYLLTLYDFLVYAQIKLYSDPLRNTEVVCALGVHIHIFLVKNLELEFGGGVFLI